MQIIAMYRITIQLYNVNLLKSKIFVPFDEHACLKVFVILLAVSVEVGLTLTI